jgi:hypothetical protein
MENRYAALLSAARQLRDIEKLSFDEIDQLCDTRIAAILQANQSALSAAREALGTPCWVSLENTAEFFEKNVRDFGLVLSLYMAFMLELISAKRSERFADAVRVAIDMLSLANAVRRGGLVADLLLSITLSEVAVGRLWRLRDRLTSDEFIRLAAALMHIDEERESFGDVATRDAKWEQEAIRSSGSASCREASLPEDFVPENEEMASAVNAIMAFAALPKDAKHVSYQNLDHRATALMRLLALESALRAYHSAYGSYPRKPDVLVPDFIKNIPLDPFVCRPFPYRLQKGSFVVYSVGPSGIDSGGRFGTWQEMQCGAADLCLDAFDFGDG